MWYIMKPVPHSGRYFFSQKKTFWVSIVQDRPSFKKKKTKQTPVIVYPNPTVLPI